MPRTTKNNAEIPAKIRKAWMNILIVMSLLRCFRLYNMRLMPNKFNTEKTAVD